MDQTVEQAIEAVYAAFRHIPKPSTVDGCPCCLDEKGVSILLSKPLRSLSPNDLTHYASSVFLTVGSVDDFLYFLPRILEILAAEEGWWPEPEIVARSVNTAGFHSWPAPRKDAVFKYFMAMYSSLLLTKRSGSEIDSWIGALGRLQIDLVPVLSDLLCHPERLIEFYERNSRCLAKGRLSNGFWDDTPSAHQQVVDWFSSAATRTAIESAYGLS